MSTNRNCIDCPELGLPVGPQGEPGIQGPPGTAGNDGANGTDGFSAYYTDTVNTGNANVVGPTPVRTTTITAAMIPSDGDALWFKGLVGWSAATLASGALRLKFGGSVLATIAGLPSGEAFDFDCIMTRVSANSQEWYIKFGHGNGASYVNWIEHKYVISTAADLTISNNFVIEVDDATGSPIAANAMSSENILVLKIKKV